LGLRALLGSIPSFWSTLYLNGMSLQEQSELLGISLKCCIHHRLLVTWHHGRRNVYMCRNCQKRIYDTWLQVLST